MSVERRKFDELKYMPTNIGYANDRLCDKLYKQLEYCMIEGLKRKGFEFENRIELENFIKENCRCEDRSDINERTYFVNDVPFFLHSYKIEMEFDSITTDRGLMISANFGRYTYL